MVKEIGASLLLLSLASSCVRESPEPPSETKPASLPSAQTQPAPPLEPQKLPPTVAQPELAAEPEPGTEKGARAFVTLFLQARMAGDDRLARTHLSAIARDQFDKAEGGLALTAPPGSRFAGWDFVSVQAIDASSYEVKVTVRGPGGAAHTETLFVGPGPDLNGAQKPWIVRGAMQEV
ncbi:MAG TPA: hypothetical protein VJ725_19530 [Thermoanaerobaculia bacterium]|nr:hypothetical protein [Thermoanaerobaculia bacterium]